MANNAKQIVYIYNGMNNEADVEFDQDGEISIPADNTTISRNGKLWKVIRHTVEQTVAGPRAVPVVRINLSDQF